MFNDLTSAQIWEKITAIMDKAESIPGHGQTTILGIQENHNRICLYGIYGNAIHLRLEYNGGQKLDSGRILEYRDRWKTTATCILATQQWLEQIHKIKSN